MFKRELLYLIIYTRIDTRKVISLCGNKQCNNRCYSRDYKDVEKGPALLCFTVYHHLFICLVKLVLVYGIKSFLLGNCVL